jgi:predicted transcriptional regulator
MNLRNLEFRDYGIFALVCKLNDIYPNEVTHSLINPKRRTVLVKNSLIRLVEAELVERRTIRYPSGAVHFVAYIPIISFDDLFGELITYREASKW